MPDVISPEDEPRREPGAGRTALDQVREAAFVRTRPQPARTRRARLIELGKAFASLFKPQRESDRPDYKYDHSAAKLRRNDRPAEPK